MSRTPNNRGIVSDNISFYYNSRMVLFQSLWQKKRQVCGKIRSFSKSTNPDWHTQNGHNGFLTHYASLPLPESSMSPQNVHYFDDTGRLTDSNNVDLQIPRAFITHKTPKVWRFLTNASPPKTLRCLLSQGTKKKKKMTTSYQTV